MTNDARKMISRDHEDLVDFHGPGECCDTFSGTDEHGQYRMDWLIEEFVLYDEAACAHCACERCAARHA